jgi:REP element-mobilizing transposase RayT
MMGHEEHGFCTTFCFVIMPDHLHWMLQLGKGKNLGNVVQSFKSLTSHKLGRRVFQKGFYDHAVRKEEDLRNLARYIIANPLRAGLVEDIHAYPHWDAIWM